MEHFTLFPEELVVTIKELVEGSISLDNVLVTGSIFFDNVLVDGSNAPEEEHVTSLATLHIPIFVSKKRPCGQVSVNRRLLTHLIYLTLLHFFKSYFLNLHLT